MPITIITGGSGLIGRSLTNYLISLGHDIIIFTRKSLNSDRLQVTYKLWDPEKGTLDIESIQKADYIINLAGAGVMDKPWTPEYKKLILNSRVASGKVLSQALDKTTHGVKAFIAASAIGWYGEDKTDLKHTYGFIESDPPAKGFLGETCLLWEESVNSIEKTNTRLVKLRFGIVLSNEGGAFPEFKNSLKFGVASILGNGKQIISWIHIDDLCRMIVFAMQDDTVTGIYNAVSPEPVRNKEMIIHTAKTLRHRFYVPVHVPKMAIQLMLGERSTEILKSATVNCKKIKTAGFTFLYPSLKLALDELCKNA